MFFFWPVYEVYMNDYENSVLATRAFWYRHVRDREPTDVQTNPWKVMEYLRTRPSKPAFVKWTKSTEEGYNTRVRRVLVEALKVREKYISEYYDEIYAEHLERIFREMKLFSLAALRNLASLYNVLNEKPKETLLSLLMQTWRLKSPGWILLELMRYHLRRGDDLETFRQRIQSMGPSEMKNAREIRLIRTRLDENENKRVDFRVSFEDLESYSRDLRSVVETYDIDAQHLDAMHPFGTRENEPNSGRPLTVSLSLPFDHAESDLNAKLKPQLQSIYASLKLNSEVTATNVTILNSLLDDILVQMKRKDPLFHLVFKRCEFTGSYYDGLRIKKADEFDVDLVLNLPFEKDEFIASDGCPGHVGYEVSTAAVDRLHREGDAKWVPLLLDLMDGERRLVPERVTRWLESVLGSVLGTYVVSSGPCSAIEKIRLRQHGPAVTLYIKLKDGNQIDVDLVPVIEFRHPSWPTGVQKKGWMANMLPEDSNWFLIPKPPMSMPKSHLWRLHFPNIEKRLIEDKGCVKPIIRLLKAMRDSYGWNLSSYSLKMFVMSQVAANDDAQYWHPDNQGMLFVRSVSFL
ncbi:uncharacterized protein LOC115318168 [Ixodes scapularis]|uniref:uncharacterized protein LOC115318168 n=1 Tax=Ixodes scapularis TaxID=6945 RepID=UPI001A9DE99D|nr:uncharacterized protein LOC115318168 [Ixodes scapularis]